VSVLVDSLDAIEEQDEANNDLTGTLTIQEFELHPVSLEFDKSHVRLDEEVTIYSRIRNTREGVVKTVEVGFYIDGQLFGEDTVGPLGLNGEATAEVSLIPRNLWPGVNLQEYPKEHTIRVVVDPHNRIHELDEANNAFSKSLTIFEEESKLPELHPESLELNPPSPIELGKANALTVCSVVKNTGKARADGFGVQFSYRVKGSRRWKSIPCRDPVSCTELALDSGAELKAEGNLPIVLLSPGIYEIRVAVDPLQGCDTTACSDIGKIEELDETNNELVTTFTLLSSRLPDLSPDPAMGVEVAPSYMVKRGQTLRFLANIANLGDLAAGQFKVEFAYCRQPESISPEATDQMCAETDFVTFARVSLPELGI
ncbi:hypothetical protein KAX17_07500, partial [Candidatus Bipolaricaulota bacterium]|nr:hypothetical protein [Candidatus Bipolaricaulota bacterium]